MTECVRAPVLAAYPDLRRTPGAGLLAQDSPGPIPPIEDTPGLPRVLLIGDSISIGYTLPVRRLLAGKANVHRISGNAGPTSNGVFLIDGWLARRNGM